MIGWLIIPFFVAMFAGVPIAFSLALGVMLFLFISSQVPLEIVAQQLYQASASFPLMAIPFFLLAGDLMDRTGITSRIIRFVTVLIGRVHGGLAQVMILTGTIFAGLSGSGSADTAALTKVMAPGMEKEGYDIDFCAGLAAAVGVLGPIIPPSIVMIVYGSMMNLSVGALFMAGILPGLMIGIGMMVMAYFLSKKRNYPRREEPFTWGELASGFKDASLALLMPIIILYGIRGGVFTPTEGGAIAVLYALILGVLVYRTLTISDFVHALVASGMTAAVIMLIVATANAFGWLMALNSVPQMMGSFLLDFAHNKYILLLLINVLLIFMGMIMETNAIILLLAPILAPVAVSMGIDPIHFALVVVVNLCIGLATPPVGLNLFVSASATGISMERVTKAAIPFVLVELTVLVLITYLPEIVLVVPRALGML